jgi:succinate dehydrogenase / fumarate reductase flavoprotein subunit
MKTALVELDKLRARSAQVSAAGGRAYNPGWHLALDLRNMLVVAECVAQAALERQESRGGHTRDDYPAMSPEWRKINLICSLDADGDVALKRQPIVPMRTDLLELFDIGELKKYMTEDELAGLPASAEETPPSAPPIGAPPGVPPEAGQTAPSSEAPARKAGE